MKKLPKPLAQAINRLATERARADYERIRRELEAEAVQAIANGIDEATVREDFEQRVTDVILETAQRQTHAFLNRNATALRARSALRARERGA